MSKDTLVLGALSCGAFKFHKEIPGETATLLANAYREVLLEDKYRHAFKKITFAILSDPSQKINNFNVFSKHLNKLDLSAGLKKETSNEPSLTSSSMMAPTSSLFTSPAVSDPAGSEKPKKPDLIKVRLNNKTV